MTIQTKTNNESLDEQSKELGSYKIYLLKRIFSVGYDEYEGKVIIASSAKAARKMANIKYADEGPIWTDSSQVICKEISLTMPLIVLEAFKRGCESYYGKEV